jgi:hypothetical protein
MEPTRAPPASRRAPDSVVSTAPDWGSRARPAGSRLSSCWSWLSKTASIGPISAAAMAGPASFREIAPQPKWYRRPGGSNVGSVNSRQPPDSSSTVGPPICVMRTSVMRSCSSLIDVRFVFWSYNSDAPSLLSSGRQCVPSRMEASRTDVRPPWRGTIFAQLHSLETM